MAIYNSIHFIDKSETTVEQNSIKTVLQKIVILSFETTFLCSYLKNEKKKYTGYHKMC